MSVKLPFTSQATRYRLFSFASPAMLPLLRTEQHSHANRDRPDASSFSTGSNLAFFQEPTGNRDHVLAESVREAERLLAGRSFGDRQLNTPNLFHILHVSMSPLAILTPMSQRV